MLFLEKNCDFMAYHFIPITVIPITSDTPEDKTILTRQDASKAFEHVALDVISGTLEGVGDFLNFCLKVSLPAFGLTLFETLIPNIFLVKKIEKNVNVARCLKVSFGQFRQF